MIDIKITSDGDIDVEENGDVMLTGGGDYETSEDEARFIAQLAFIAVKTEKGDYVLHPELGNDLSKLAGLPNKPSTADAGRAAIVAALRGYTITNSVNVDSWPEDLNTVKYEVKITVGSPPKTLVLTLSQALAEAGYIKE